MQVLPGHPWQVLEADREMQYRLTPSGWLGTHARDGEVDSVLLQCAVQKCHYPVSRSQQLHTKACLIPSQSSSGVTLCYAKSLRHGLTLTRTSGMEDFDAVIGTGANPHLSSIVNQSLSRLLRNCAGPRQAINGLQRLDFRLGSRLAIMANPSIVKCIHSLAQQLH